LLHTCNPSIWEAEAGGCNLGYLVRPCFKRKGGKGKGGREKEREGRREGEREGGKEGGRKKGRREGGKEGRREGRKEVIKHNVFRGDSADSEADVEGVKGATWECRGSESPVQEQLVQRP
jgi:flagellar biosynthesis/type III secretory pathway protein FliH